MALLPRKPRPERPIGTSRRSSAAARIHAVNFSVIDGTRSPKTKNFGHKSLNEIKEILREMGLELGMRVEHFPSREEIEARKRAAEKETA